MNAMTLVYPMIINRSGIRTAAGCLGSKVVHCLLITAVTGLFSGLNIASEPAVTVNVLNFVQAATAGKFDKISRLSGGVNQWQHNRAPTPLDQQRVTRMNRDTLYSSAVIDISEGASFWLPAAGERYLSATVINEDHYINKIFHGPGEHRLTLEEFDTPYVLLTVRILVNAADPADINKANDLQDLLVIKSGSAKPYRAHAYDQASYQVTEDLLRQLARGLPNAQRTYGSQQHVDQVRHLLGSAYGWGGLPESESIYINVQPKLPVGSYSLTVRDVPVDGFWSISMYNKDGFFERNDYGSYSVNNLTAISNADGSYTVNFGGDPASKNFLPITEGWNYVVRLYRPSAEIVDGSWSFPAITPVPLKP